MQYIVLIGYKIKLYETLLSLIEYYSRKTLWCQYMPYSNMYTYIVQLHIIHTIVGAKYTPM